VHGAFQRGAKVSGWALDRFLSSLYWLLKDSPARREDFIEATGTTVMPLKFCNHRWVENVVVCERGISLLPAVVKYVAAVTAKEYPDPGTKSYSTVCQEIKDPLLPAKLAAFLSIAKLLQPFLDSFQTDAPMIPFLHSELVKMMKSIMERFIKADIPSNTRNAHSIDVSADKNLSTYAKVDVGFSAQKILKEVQAE